MAINFDKAKALRFATLTSMLGVDENSLLDYLNWCLLEQLVDELAQDKTWIDENRAKRDALAQFKNKVQLRTNAKWDNENISLLWDRVRMANEKHYRQPITYGELLRLMVNTPLECANSKCKKRPPDVKLHIDHRFPASKGGSSTFENLQFLCERCNLAKSDKLQETEIWIKLESLQLY